VVENIPPGGAFEVQETGWGEFEITIKLYYTPDSLEKPQTLYHHLRLHPYGNTDAEKEAMRLAPSIDSWVYEEQLFNEPYEGFYDILTSPVDRIKGAGGKGTRVMKGGMVGSVGERTALIPLTSRPGQPFSRETERAEIKRLGEARVKVEEMTGALQRELKEKEEELARLKAGS
jgi:YEATS domain-containing protein 4